METHPSSDSQTQDRQGEASSIGDSQMADSVLVADGHATLHTQTYPITSISTMELDRLAIFRQHQNATHPLEIVDYLQGANRTTTHKNYNQVWKNWALWCYEQAVSAMEYDPTRVLRNLLFKETPVYTTPNNIRSAIASVFRVLHSTKPPLASHPAIMAFFDMGNIEFRDISVVANGLTVVARSPKEVKPKSSKVGRVPDIETCPVATMETYLQRTTAARTHLPVDHTLFLQNLDSQQIITSIKPSTAASWLQTIMKDAGINTKKIKSHSLRSAASTKAVLKGIPMDTVKLLHANWSLKANTFETYYYKPTNQHARGSAINQQIFDSSTENRTTSEVGVEATTIVLGTIHNGQVAET